MFKDLQKGFPVHILDKSSEEGVKYYLGTVVFAGAPRFENTNQNGQASMNYEKYIDLTVEFNGKNQTFVVPETGNVAGRSTHTLSCSNEFIVNELNALIKSNSAVIESVPKCEKTISDCREILKEVDKNYAKESRLEERMDRIEKSLEKFTRLLEKVSD